MQCFLCVSFPLLPCGADSINFVDENDARSLKNSNGNGKSEQMLKRQQMFDMTNIVGRSSCHHILGTKIPNLKAASHAFCRVNCQTLLLVYFTLISISTKVTNDKSIKTGRMRTPKESVNHLLFHLW